MQQTPQKHIRAQGITSQTPTNQTTSLQSISTLKVCSGESPNLSLMEDSEFTGPYHQSTAFESTMKKEKNEASGGLLTANQMKRETNHWLLNSNLEATTETPLTLTPSYPPTNERNSSLLDWLNSFPQELPNLSRFPLALSPKMKRTRSCTSCEGTHVTSGINTRQTPSNLTGIRTMETTAWQLDA
jgi:hypothetical protein